MPTEVYGSSRIWFDNSVDRALHLYRRGHGFESRPASEVVCITVIINEWQEPTERWKCQHNNAITYSPTHPAVPHAFVDQ